MSWPKDVHVEHARSDGRSPEDFRIDQWPVSDVHLHQPRYTTPREVALTYRATVPADTPVDVRGGMALQSVRFTLRDDSTGERLDQDSRLHTDGDVRGFLSGPCELWNRLTPGGPVVRVRLYAFPRFYFINEDGGMVGYSTIDFGHFRGDEVRSSKVYVLQMLDDGAGTILVDGERRPAPPEPVHEGLAEYERLRAEEEAERKRIEQEMRDRLAREEAERQARWAREDAEREAERKRAAEAAEAERKRNEAYVQRRPEETDDECVAQLREIYDYHLKGMPGGDEKWRDYLTTLAGGTNETFAAAARKLAGERGWSL